MYLHDWKLSCSHGMKEDFNITDDKLEGVEILLASYGDANCSGDAFVLFRKDSKLYEVNGSHCSCYGLEGQWQPEETTIKALKSRLKAGVFGHDHFSGNEFAKELHQLLNKMEAANA